ncbi:MafI family immunity protein [Cellulomonas sp. SG140]|uniref:MafI family immunity protein n=1 Tax=Cellulomonas sp. SG140 TaxID=2976536 RepID=UPI0021E79792|nr:MafI family immunity protein [Cellulomonas sp. SG140]
MDALELRGRLFAMLVCLDDRLPADQAALIHKFVDVGEWGLALEQIADVLSEDEIGLHDEERAELLAHNSRMEMGDRVPNALGLCPSIH